ncbi:ADAMTS-like protein 5 isoform X1 [Patiria miniata]|uniref:NTR domain-containing protein n=1 Tax=Patiria miniata TaxID=46514 RepID=A0A914BRA6_PATMI|nr:ADAMTS-like protein 5 isoform X1 [Patiria miniata]XP_038078500.1 ADAMTS-like protein 5 isoform X1 [Patiria miniata]
MRQGSFRVVLLVIAACLVFSAAASAKKDARRGRRGFKGSDRDKNSIVWSRWSDWSECSRTCGGGAKYRTRHCMSRKPANDRAGLQVCEEESKQYRSCNTKPCPPGSQDYRAMQCAIYNEKPLVEWVPVEEDNRNECDLVCKTTNGAYELNFRHVVDGTRCRRHSMDMCINGKCQTVGCDGVLNSTSGYDVCGVCGGGNQTCGQVHKTYSEEYPSTGFYTYNRIIMIPAGATNIKIKDKSTLNFVALKDETGQFLLNGDWTIDWPGEYKGVGTKIVYQRHRNGSEEVRLTGPTDKILEVMIIFRERNPGVEYEYWMPPRKAAGPPEVQDQLLSDDIIADGEAQPSELSESETKPESSSSSNVTQADEEEEGEETEAEVEAGRGSRRRGKKDKGKKKGKGRGKETTKKCPKCRKVRGSRTSHFCENDFVLHVEILSKAIENGQTRFDTTILQTYKNTVHLGRREYIWVPNVCKCPRLKTGGQYLVTGNRRFDTETGETRLVVDRDNLVSAWKDGYHKKWDKIQARESLVCSQGEEEETEGPTGRF